ncbi:unnamed protein product, partial [Cyprideis torosa]
MSSSPYQVSIMSSMKMALSSVILARNVRNVSKPLMARAASGGIYIPPVYKPPKPWRLPPSPGPKKTRHWPTTLTEPPTHGSVHFGHSVGTLDPRMAPFLFGERLGHTIFDLDQTAVYLEAALNFIAHIAYRDGIIMFVSRNPATCLMIEDLAKEVGEFAHTRRWMTDILTSPLNTFGGMTRLPELLIFLNTLDN